MTTPNISATHFTQTNGTPKKPNTTLDILGTRFADVLEGLVVAPTHVESTPNSQPVTTQPTQPAEIAKATTNAPVKKNDSGIKDNKEIVKSEDQHVGIAVIEANKTTAPTTIGVHDVQHFVAAASLQAAPQDEADIRIEGPIKEVKFTETEHENSTETASTDISNPNDAVVLHVAPTTPTTVIVLPQQITANRSTEDREQLAQTPIKLDTHSSVSTPHIPDAPTVLPQNLADLVRSNQADQTPKATVEVRTPEERLPFVQLPLSVMQHAPAQPQAQSPSVAVISASGPLTLSKDAHGEGGSLSSNHDERTVNQGLSASKLNTAKPGERPQATPKEKAVMQEMIQRIRNMLKDQRQDMKVTVQHAEYGQVTMNLRFTNQNKQVNAVFMSDNDDLLGILQRNNDEITQVFQNAGVSCQQQHVRRV